MSAREALRQISHLVPTDQDRWIDRDVPSVIVLGKVAAIASNELGGAGPYSIGSDSWPGLSKVIEECGELMQVAGKIIATDGDPAHWDGSDLRDRLTEEAADLLAAVSFLIEANHLNVAERNVEKLDLFRKWHAEQGRADA